MTYKSVMTLWDGRDESRAAFDMAVEMVRQNDGHLNVLCLGIDVLHSGLYYAGATPIVISENIEMARNTARELEQEVNKMLAGSNINWSCQASVAQFGGLPTVVGNAARFNDLVVLPKPYGDNAPSHSAAVLEAAMFEGGAPVLVCPPDAKQQLGQRILVAWNESAEALVAIKAALPLIAKAESVDLVVIDPAEHGETRSDPGVELSKMLARHGAKVSVSVLAKTVPRISEVLARHATDFGADMVVMGAYGHSRFRESILGGATRDMLEDTECPVFMAH